MKPISVKRKWVMDRLALCLNAIDPSGDNKRLYEEKFNKMSDKEFDKYMREFLSDEENNFYLEMIEYKRDLKMENIEAAADAIGVPLYERVAMPYLSDDLDDVPLTPEPVPVGYIHMKRMVQMLLKKNSTSIDVTKRSSKTGQVTGDSKTSRNSDVEAYSMIASNNNMALKELMGFRADDIAAKQEAENQISTNGYVYLKDLPSNLADKVALNTLDMYFIMQGFKTNLVTGGRVLPSANNQK